MKFKTLNKRNLAAAAKRLAEEQEEFAIVLAAYGTPPLWDRPAGFATLLQIILEQQVSLASAKACFDKLGAHLGEVTPAALMRVNDNELRMIGFSRQKAAYARHLAEAVLEQRIDLNSIHLMEDAEAKAELTRLKGVGEWTSDIYLLMAMLRPDVMPKGDIALHAAYQKLTRADKRPGSDEFLVTAQKWRPFRSVAARLLWHYYLSEKRARSIAEARA